MPAVSQLLSWDSPRLPSERANSTHVKRSIVTKLRNATAVNGVSDSDSESTEESHGQEQEPEETEANYGTLTEAARFLLDDQVGEEQDLEALLSTDNSSENDSESDSCEDEAWDFIESIEAEEIWRMITARKSIRISRWEQFGTVKSIGGVHSGKMVLFLIEAQDGSKMLADGNTRHAFSGGQIYLPMSKKIIHDQDLTRNKVIPTLPSILMNLFAHTGALNAEVVQGMKERAVWSVKKLKDHLHHAALEIQLKHSSNALRHEMFLMCSGGETSSFQEQVQDHVSSWVVSKSTHLMRQCVETMHEVVGILCKICLENNMEQWNWLAPSLKAMIVLCAEMAVKLAGFHPFEGRIMKQLRPDVEMDGNVHVWRVPRELLQACTQAEYDSTGLMFGLKMDCLALPLSLSTARPQSDDRKASFMKLPLYIQMYQKLNDIGVNDPAFFLKSIMQIHSLAWNQIDRRVRAERCLEQHRQQQRQQSIGLFRNRNGTGEMDSDDPPTMQDFVPRARNAFTPVDHKRLAKCTPQQLEEWLQQVARVLANLYDFEWWNKIESAIQKHHMKHKKGRYTKTKLCDFPTTVTELDRHLKRLNDNSGDGETKFCNRGDVAKGIVDVVTTDAQFETLVAGSTQTDRLLNKDWSRSPTRNLLRYVATLRSRVMACLPDDNEDSEADSDLEVGHFEQPRRKVDILGNENFRRVLRKVFCSAHRRGPSDTSDAIVWHTSPGAQYRTPHEASAKLFVFQPMKLRVGEVRPPNTSRRSRRFQEEHKPAKLSRAQAPPPWFADAKLEERERIELCMSGHTDWLSIVKVRLLLHMAFAENSFVLNVREWHAHFYSCQLTPRTSLLDFHFTTKRIRNSMRRLSSDLRQQVQSGEFNDWNSWLERAYPSLQAGHDERFASEKRILAAMCNFQMWDSPNKNPFQPNFESLFLYEEERDKADKCLQKEGWRSAMVQHAARGIITPRFLDTMKQELHNICKPRSKRKGAALQDEKVSKRPVAQTSSVGPDAGAGH